MYLREKNKLLFAAGIIISVILVSVPLYYILRGGKTVAPSTSSDNNSVVEKTQNINQEPKKYPFDDKRTARTQEEIWTEYEKNINKLVDLVNNSTGNVNDILSQLQVGFFDIFVPTEKKDLHVQTMLKIQKMQSEGTIQSREELKDAIVPLLQALLQR